MTAIERREYPRLPLNLPLTLMLSGTADPVRGRLRDISQGGCFVTVDSGIGRDGRITMDFVVLPRAICNATGRVVRDQGQDGFGVEFGATNEALQKFVARLEGASPTEREAMLARVLDPEIHVT